ncbi:MAG: M28 family peptidase [Fimbriimonas sp.]
MKRARLFALVPLFAVALAGAQYPGAVAPPADVKKGFDRITIDEAKRHLGYLAGPECAGRGTGQPGYQKAAEYVAARFKEYGLKPVGPGGTYFQNVPFYATGVVPGSTDIVVGNRRVPANSVLITSAPETLDLKGKFVVLDVKGDRIDLAGPDLEGAIVVVRGDQRSQIRARAAVSRAKAAAILYETEKLPDATPSVSRQRGGGGRGRAGLPTGYILKEAVQSISSAVVLNELKFASAEGGANGASSYGPIALTAKMETKEVPVPNVVGLIEGTDPTLKAEIVGIGAHLDHLGVVNGVTYWGADDDGSGSAALIQVAAAFAANPVKPKRSILFMAFCGEEMGLIGSGYYSDNPLFPHEKMIAELQMDMVGRDSDGAQNGDPNRMDKASENRDTMRLVGSKRISTELDKTIQDLNRHIGFKFKYDAEDVYTRSDHYNFAKKGIPIAFLFDGFHPEYHQPTDTIEKINFTKLTSAAKLFYLTAMKLANTPERPKKDVPQTGGGR